MSKVTIIAGLGNPEEKYERTLHNAGFWFVDALVQKYGGLWRYEKKFDAAICRITLHGDDTWLVKPQSYMNLSGQPVRGMLDYYRLKTAGLLVAHDEIDLPPGTVRLKKGGGHGGHNGIRDVIQHCGADFLRLRTGREEPGDELCAEARPGRRGSRRRALAGRGGRGHADTSGRRTQRGDEETAHEERHLR